MRVWVLMMGEHCEGGSILGLYASRELALRAAGSVPPPFNDEWLKRAGDAWESGCDWLRIHEQEVQS